MELLSRVDNESRHRKLRPQQRRASIWLANFAFPDLGLKKLGLKTTRLKKARIWKN